VPTDSQLPTRACPQTASYPHERAHRQPATHTSVPTDSQLPTQACPQTASYPHERAHRQPVTHTSVPTDSQVPTRACPQTASYPHKRAHRQSATHTIVTVPGLVAWFEIFVKFLGVLFKLRCDISILTINMCHRYHSFMTSNSSVGTVSILRFRDRN